MIIEMLIYFSSTLFLFHLGNAIRWFVSKRQPSTGKDKKHAGFSILVPCFNEEVVISSTIQRLLELDYDKFEVIFVDDGSTDQTFLRLQEELGLKRKRVAQTRKATGCQSFQSTKYPNFQVLKKPNTGKGDSLNSAIAFSKYKLLVTLDADSYLAKDTLKIMNRCFADKCIIAAGGAIHVAQSNHWNGRSLWRRTLINLQMLDYMKGFYIYKLSLSEQNATAIISGAFGVFRKEPVLQAGGFRTSLGEDIDLTLKLQALAQSEGKQIAYLPHALCYTQCPESIRDLTRQRMRWQKGFVDCIVHFARRQLRSVFSRGLSYHLYIEAFLMGTLSAVFSFTNILCLLLWPTRAAVIIYVVYHGLRILLRAVYNIVALVFSNQLHGSKPTMDFSFWLAVFIDLFIFGWYLMAIYILGTMQYFWQGDRYYQWNKAKRNEVICAEEASRNG